MPGVVDPAGTAQPDGPVAPAAAPEAQSANPPADEPAAASKPRRARRSTRSSGTATGEASGDAPSGDTPSGDTPSGDAPAGAAPTGGEPAEAPSDARPALDVLSELGRRDEAPSSTKARRSRAKSVALDPDALLAGAEAARRGQATATGAASTDSAEKPEDASAADVPAPKKPRARRTTRRSAEAPAEVPAEVAVPGETPEEPDQVTSEPATDSATAPKRRAASTRAGAKGSRTSKSATTEPADEPAKADKRERTSKAKAPAADQRTDASAAVEPGDKPASTSGSPRLATTALLFQAPDPAKAPRRPRRAQSPAGPPRHAEPTDAPEQVPAASDPAPEPTTAATATERPARSSSQKSTGTRARRGKAGRAAGAPQERAPQQGQPQESAPQGSTPRESTPRASEPNDVSTQDAPLTGTDLAAAEEVELIESELVAEGVSLAGTTFGAQDFAPDESGSDLGTEATDSVDIGAEADEDTEDTEDDGAQRRRRRRRGGRGRRGRNGEPGPAAEDASANQGDGQPSTTADTADESAETSSEEDAGASTGSDEDGEDGGSSRRRRRRRRGGRSEGGDTRGRSRERTASDEVTALKGSTRLEAKRQRRREGRDAGRRRQIISEAEFLARREAVERAMVVREQDGRTQIAVLEDGVLVEHYVSQQSQVSMAGNVYLGRVQNVLPSMEAAFVDIGKGRNAVLYAGEVNWDAAGLQGQPRRIEDALSSGDPVLVQVTKDPIGHKGARLTAQVTLAGRYLVLVPGGGMTGISRKLPDTERNRLKKILKEVVPDGAGVIVRTAAEGASEDELRADVERLRGQWEAIETKAKKSSSAPVLLQGEPDLAIRVVRDIFNDDFSSLVVEGGDAWSEISSYVEELAPDLRERVSKWTGTQDVFTVHRVDEQLAKGMDRKVWLPSGGSLVIDRTEAMTVVDVNTGKFTGSGGTLEETVTRNNLEAAEEIVRQLRLRDIGGIIVIDFIDMVLESNRDLVLRRLVECLGRDRTKHQVAEVTSLGLVQMTRKRVGQGLVEAFSSTCEHCHGRGFVVHADPVEKNGGGNGHQHGASTGDDSGDGSRRTRRKRGGSGSASGSTEPAAQPHAPVPVLPEVTSEARAAVKATLATIAAAAAHAHEHGEHADGNESSDHAGQDESSASAATTVDADAASADAGTTETSEPAAGSTNPEVEAQQ
ncbi:Rne/Rng family ribonuclease [Cellulosimicrobium arenosum]|uniref:Ribonuclease E n=1 Tax=Cellulosimicrobium arenosum TaxID=2708133 RepID=A0A927PGB9_9MICO|nr:Rne/Rng family ribonuclease [Cellulosimicrobium arenosum]